MEPQILLFNIIYVNNCIMFVFLPDVYKLKLYVLSPPHIYLYLEQKIRTNKSDKNTKISIKEMVFVTLNKIFFFPSTFWLRSAET